MEDEIIARLRKLAVATLSDGCDQIAGRRGFMDSGIQGRVNARKFAGRAATVLEVPCTERLKPELAFDLIDAAPRGSVIVISNGGNADVAIWGELMNAGAVANGHEAVVLEGGVRDVELIRSQTDFPVFARSVVAASSIGRMMTLARDVPVQAGGVVVNPGDYIVGDADGVVVIPPEHVQAIATFAEEAEAVEAEMAAYIREKASMRAAIDKFGRA
ncbi:MAG: RraA family protein [Rhodobacteraceae bacterium]|jgi:4-hydroxy-4-methyl-2-oxoglutarate aldolase|nr:RraA family protein [Paracoccaceae bacterium]